MKKTLLLAFILLATVLVYGDYQSSGGSNSVTLTTEFAGDVTGPYNATVVGNDSHAHTTTTISGLTVDDISMDRVRLELVANYTLANNSFVPLAFAATSEEYDTASWHDDVTNNSRVTVGATGVYSAICNVDYSNTVTDGPRRADILLNGTTVLDYFQVVTNAEYTALSVSTVWEGSLTASDYLECRAHQTNSGTSNVTVVAGGTFFTVRRIP